MYKLKNLDNVNKGYQSTISDQQYDNLFFYKKWKYEKSYPTKIDTGSVIIGSRINKSTTYRNDSSDGFLAGMLVNELLNNQDYIIGSDDQSIVALDTLPQSTDFQGFGGGDAGGGGSSDSFEVYDDTTIDDNQNFS